jgi:hypothetical protein
VRRRRVAAPLAVVAVLTLVGGGCAEDEPVVATHVTLDGSPRPATEEGILVDVADDFSTLTLDGDRKLAVDPALVSFSAGDGKVVPLLRLRGQYVQLGVDDGVAEWIGGISAVVDLPPAAPVAYFTDVLVEIDDGVATFRSGTVLDLAPGVEPPGPAPVAVVATIDVGSRQITALEPG